MKEIYDFRIAESRAADVLPANVGHIFPGRSVRKVITSAGSEVFEQIMAADQAARRDGNLFYSSWSVRRRYSTAEIRQAQLFRLSAVRSNQIHEYVEIKGESGIALDKRRLPRRPLIAMLGGELIVAAVLANALAKSSLTGFQLRRVHHMEFIEERSYRLERLKAGQELLARAAAEGSPFPSGSFWTWLAQPNQRALLDTARQEDWARGERGRRRREQQPVPWYEVTATSSPVVITSPTRFGERPGAESTPNEYRNEAEMVAGFSILSQCYVAESSWDGSDFIRTREKVGHTSGLFRPNPLTLVSPALRALLLDHKVSPSDFEVAHFTSGADPVF